MRVDRKEMAYRRVTTRTGRKGVVKLVRIGVGGWFFPSCFCGKRYAWSAERGTATSRYGRFVSSAQIDDYNRFWFHRRVVFGLAAQIFSMFCFHFLTGDLCQVILLHLPGFIVNHLNVMHTNMDLGIIVCSDSLSDIATFCENFQILIRAFDFHAKACHYILASSCLAHSS